MSQFSMMISQKKKVIKALEDVGFKKFPYFKVRNVSLKNKLTGESHEGMFTRGTQFTKDLYVEVDMKYIWEMYPTVDERRKETALTIAHELGHSIVEVMETYEGTDKFEGIDWRKDFTDDEEEFVELFAEWLMDGTILDAPYFEEIIPIIARVYEELLE